MSEKLKELLEEFEWWKDAENVDRGIQGKELQSIQRAIKIVSEEETLNEEERKKVDDIVNMDNQWWCKISQGRLF